MTDPRNQLSIEAGEPTPAPAAPAVEAPRRPAASRRPVPDGSAAGAEVARLEGLLAGVDVVRIAVRARAERDLPAPFPGSLVRGGLGASLRSIACPEGGAPLAGEAGPPPHRPRHAASPTSASDGRRELATPRPGLRTRPDGLGSDSSSIVRSCAGCARSPECLYAALFEPAGAGAGWPAGGRGSPVRPFALVPPDAIAAGPFTFEVKLFGAAAAGAATVAAAIAGMGRAGIGRERVRLEVEAIESVEPGRRDGPAAYDPSIGPVPFAVRPFPAAHLLAPWDGDDRRPRRMSLLLRTPLRMKEAGRIGTDLPPERLVRAALRRWTDLAAAAPGAGDWPREWPAVLAAAREVRVERMDLRWVDRGRFSLRQGRAMRLGGAVGAIVLAGISPALVAVIRAGAFAGLGKNTTFGLGVVEVGDES